MRETVPKLIHLVAYKDARVSRCGLIKSEDRLLEKFPYRIRLAKDGRRYRARVDAADEVCNKCWEELEVNP